MPVDLREQDDAYVLTAYVPGLKAEDLNIQILDDTVTIEGEYAPREGYALLDELLRAPSAVPCACQPRWMPPKPKRTSRTAC